MGIQFQTISWTPDRAKYEKQLCHGFSVKITNLKEINSAKTFIAVSEVLHEKFQNKLKISGMDGMLGSQEFRRAIENHEPADEIIETLKMGNVQFMKQRASILMYE